MLLDDVASFSLMKVCSPRLVEYLRSLNLKNVEYLPVTILDHNDEVASQDYRIAHPIHSQDALDIAASKPSYNHIIPRQIDNVQKTVLDTSRLDPEVRFFRLKDFIVPLFLDKVIAEEIQAPGIQGQRI